MEVKLIGGDLKAFQKQFGLWINRKRMTRSRKRQSMKDFVLPYFDRHKGIIELKSQPLAAGEERTGLKYIKQEFEELLGIAKHLGFKPVPGSLRRGNEQIAKVAAELLRIARELVSARKIRNVKDAMDTVKKMDNLIDDLEEEWAAVVPVHRVGEPGPPESDMSVLLAKLQENITELQKFLKTMK